MPRTCPRPELRVRALSRLVPSSSFGTTWSAFATRDNAHRPVAPTGNPTRCARRLRAGQSAFRVRTRTPADRNPHRVAGAGTGGGERTSTSVAMAMDGYAGACWALAPAQRPRWRGRPQAVVRHRRGRPLSTLRATAILDGRVRLECAPLLGSNTRHVQHHAPRPRRVAAPRTVGDLVVDRVESLRRGHRDVPQWMTHVPLGARATGDRLSRPECRSTCRPRPAGGESAAIRCQGTDAAIGRTDEPWAAAVRIGNPVS